MDVLSANEASVSANEARIIAQMQEQLLLSGWAGGEHDRAPLKGEVPPLDFAQNMAASESERGDGGVVGSGGVYKGVRGRGGGGGGTAAAGGVGEGPGCLAAASVLVVVVVVVVVVMAVVVVVVPVVVVVVVAEIVLLLLSLLLLSLLLLLLPHKYI